MYPEELDQAQEECKEQALQQFDATKKHGGEQYRWVHDKVCDPSHSHIYYGEQLASPV